jgi:hypothetical protein
MHKDKIDVLINKVTKVCHWFLFWAIWIQSISLHPTSLGFILIFPPIYVHVFLLVSLTLTFPLKPCIYSFLLMRATCPAKFILLNLNHYNYIWRVLQAMKLVVMIYECYLIPLPSKYSPQHPVLRYPKFMFPFQSEIKFHTQKNAGKITVLYSLICMFLDCIQEDKTSWTKL